MKLINESIGWLIDWLIDWLIAGLTLDINIEQYEYIDLLSQEAGVRIFVASQNDMPFPHELGHSAPPGYATAIQLRKVLKISLTQPKSTYLLNHSSDFVSIEVHQGLHRQKNRWEDKWTEMTK